MGLSKIFGSVRNKALFVSDAVGASSVGPDDFVVWIVEHGDSAGTIFVKRIGMT